MVICPKNVLRLGMVRRCANCLTTINFPRGAVMFLSPDVKRTLFLKRTGNIYDRLQYRMAERNGSGM